MSLNSIVERVKAKTLPWIISPFILTSVAFSQELPIEWKKTGSEVYISKYKAAEVKKQQVNAWLIQDDQGNNVVDEEEYSKLALKAEMLKQLQNGSIEEEVIRRIKANETQLKGPIQKYAILLGIKIGTETWLGNFSIEDYLSSNDYESFFANLEYLSEEAYDEFLNIIKPWRNKAKDQKSDLRSRIEASRTLTPFIIADNLRDINKELYHGLQLISKFKTRNISSEEILDKYDDILDKLAESEYFVKLWNSSVKEKKLLSEVKEWLFKDTEKELTDLLDRYVYTQAEREKMEEVLISELQRLNNKFLGSIKTEDDYVFLEDLARYKDELKKDKTTVSSKVPRLGYGNESKGQAIEPPYNDKVIKSLFEDVYEIIETRYANLDKDPESELIVAFQDGLYEGHIGILDFNRKTDAWKKWAELEVGDVKDVKRCLGSGCGISGISEGSAKFIFKTIDYNGNGIQEIMVTKTRKKSMWVDSTTDLYLVEFVSHGWDIVLRREDLEIPIPEFVEVNKNGIFYDANRAHIGESFELRFGEE